MDVDGVLLFDPGCEFAGRGHGFRRFIHGQLRHLEGDVDAGGMPLVGDQEVAHRRLIGGDVRDFVQHHAREIDTTLDQIGHDQIIVGGGGVLVVGYGVDTQDERQLPGFQGQKLDRIQNFGCEDFTFARGDGEEDVVDFGIGALQLFEGEHLGIVIGEEDAVVIVERQALSTGSGNQGDGDGSDEDEPAPADDPLGEGAGRAVAIAISILGTRGHWAILLLGERLC